MFGSPLFRVLVFGLMPLSLAGSVCGVEAPPQFTPTPVIEWGKPLDGGTIRAILLLQGAKEEGLEFMRRFDVQGDVFVSKAGGKYGVDSTAASLCRRKLASEPVDVFVVGGIFWNRIPATLRLAILEHVQQGMGLLYVDTPKSGLDTTLPKLMAASPAPDAVDAVTNGIPISLLPLVTIDPERNGYTIYPDAEHPAPKPDELVSAARFGKGRICFLHYSVGQSNVVYLFSLTPGLRKQDGPFQKTYPYWEYCHSLLGKAVRWSAGRESKTRLAVEANPTSKVTEPLAVVQLNGDASDAPVDIEAVVRDRYHTVLGTTKTKLTPAPLRAEGFKVVLPANQRPPGGLYFMDVWARRNGKVVDWATATADMPSDARITSVTLDRTRYSHADPVKVTIETTGATPDARVDLTLIGTDGRLIQRQIMPARPQMTATFSLRAAQTLVSYLDARLMSGNHVSWKERLPVLLALGTLDEFFAYSWMQGETYYSRDYLRRIQDQGVNAVLAGGGAASYFFEGGRMAAETNLRVVPTNVVACRWEKGADPAKLARPLTDAKTLNEERKRIGEVVPYMSPLQPIGYSLMDEWVLGLPEARTDYSDSALAAFRVWLKGKYPDLSSLNTEWGTHFGSWDEVKPTQLEQARQGINLENVDWEKLNLTAFVDYRLFMDTVGPNAFAQLAQSIRELDPGAKVGLCGTESNSTWFGHDWFHLCNALDFIVGYGDATTIPNIANFRGLQREFQRSFRQSDSLLGCWVGYGESDFYRDQALKLLLHGFNGIAYFSGEPVAYEDFPYLNYDFTLSHRAQISSEGVREIRQGLDQLLWSSKRDNSGIAIYLSQPSLHVASALGTEGAWGSNQVAITRALEDAGMQYDFVSPGQVENGILKERSYRLLVMPGVSCLSDGEISALRSFMAVGGSFIYDRQPGVLDSHGRSRPTKPVLEGATALAFSIAPDRSANATAMRQALDKLALPCPVKLEFSEKAFLPTETIVHRNGDHLLISLQTDVEKWDQPKPSVRITLPKEGYVYDVREGKSLGKTQIATATLDPMHILLYAVLPYEVRGITVTPLQKSVKQGAPATVRLALQATGKPGTHFVRVNLNAPDGKPRPGFSRTARCNSGTGETTLTFALNDPAGKWKVIARDVETGITGTATVEVTR